MAVLAVLCGLFPLAVSADTPDRFFPDTGVLAARNAVVGEDFPSPDGRFILNHRILIENGYGAGRRITLTDAVSGGRRLVHRHQRAVALRWADDSRRFILNDFWGSNGADCFVVDVAGLRFRSPRATVIRLARRAGALDRDPDHLYVECGRWLSADSLEVFLHGHDSATRWGFDLRFAMTLDARGRFHPLSMENRSLGALND